MGEQTGTRLNQRSAVCKFPSELIRKNKLRRRRRIIMAMSLAFILTTTGLVYYWMLQPPPPYILPEPLLTFPDAHIEINGDANFSATALLEGWPGEGSPENPYIINGLSIDLDGKGRQCILIRHTRVSFIISNCYLTGADPWAHNSDAGIYLENVTNGELVDNILEGNHDGIILDRSDSNTVANNTCFYNSRSGIKLHGSDSNTVSDNTCSRNEDKGIFLEESHSNTVSGNTCNDNTIRYGGESGIYLLLSHSNTVSGNTCNNNRIGIYLENSYSNTMVNNVCLNNTEQDILEEFYIREDDPVLLLIGCVGYMGLSVITLLGGMWFVHKYVSKVGN